MGTAGPTGYTPSQIRHAYGFDQISFNGTAGDGRGTTIAIVDAYDDPNIASDLHQFDVKFGLPDPTFTKVNQSGGTSMPAANGGWASEIALDVEWAHAIAPAASILLVEANDSSFSNLLTAVQYAAGQSGVVAVSMSWGGGEFSSETAYDSSFQTPAGHGGVAFIASSGDQGAPASYPAASPNVLAVGGTTLNLASGSYGSESAWSGSGGGISAYESQPAYQKGVVTQSTAYRTNPDVAYDANPNTGFPVYDSYNNGTVDPWSQFGGTSDAAPQWAALVAIADQGRAQAGEAALNGPTQLLPMLYQLPASDFHDVTTGSSTGTPTESAGPGYDLATGRGTPIANLVVAALVGSGSTAPTTTHFGLTASAASTTAGTSFTVTVTALDANNATMTGYTGTVHFSSSDGAAGLPADYTFTSVDAGRHTFTVTLDTAGSQTVTVTDSSSSTITGTATVTVNAAAATHLAFAVQPATTTAGAVISPAVTVRVLDAYNNVVTTDNTDQVSLTLGNNTTGATLSGGGAVTVVNGVATFRNLSVSKAGTGYTLIASAGTLTGTTSNSFTITATSTSTVIESFNNGLGLYWLVGSDYPDFVTDSTAAHNGTYGLENGGNNDWIFRNDTAAQVKAGDTLSVWVKLAGIANGRAYFGFGASANGTLSLVVAPNTGQLLLQDNAGFGFSTISAVSQQYLANHWYRLEVDWGTSGTIVGKLFDNNGTTLLNTVTGVDASVVAGGFAFRGTGYDTYWDTVTVTHGVNNFSTSPSWYVLSWRGPSAAATGPFGVWSSPGASASESLGGQHPGARGLESTSAADPAGEPAWMLHANQASRVDELFALWSEMSDPFRL